MYAGGVQNEERCNGLFKTCQRVNITEYHHHQNFNPYTFKNDIALLRVNAFEPDERHISAIEIIERDITLPGKK